MAKVNCYKYGVDFLVDQPGDSGLKMGSRRCTLSVLPDENRKVLTTLVSDIHGDFVAAFVIKHGSNNQGLFRDDNTKGYQEMTLKTTPKNPVSTKAGDYFAGRIKFVDAAESAVFGQEYEEYQNSKIIQKEGDMREAHSS